MLKKMTILVLAGALILALAGCGGGSAAGGTTEAATDTSITDASKSSETSAQTPGKKFKIGVAISNYADTFVAYTLKSIQEKAKEYSSEADFIFVDCQQNASTQNTMVENLVAQGVDALIMNAVDSSACDNMIEVCNKANVPVFVFNKKLSVQDKCETFVGPDDTQIGEVQATSLVKQMGETGNVVIIMGKAGSDNTMKRTQGNKNILEKYPDIKIVGEDSASWDRAKSMAIVENWLQSGLKFNAILCNNDEMAVGAALAIKGQNKNLDDYIIAGVDGSPAGLDAVKEGNVDVTIYNSTKWIGDTVTENCVKYLKGEQINPTNYVQGTVITKDNVDEAIASWEGVK